MRYLHTSLYPANPKVVQFSKCKRRNGVDLWSSRGDYGRCRKRRPARSLVVFEHSSQFAGMSDGASTAAFAFAALMGCGPNAQAFNMESLLKADMNDFSPKQAVTSVEEPSIW